MKRKIKITVSAVFIAAFCILFSGSAMATEIKDAQLQMESLIDKKEEMEKRITELEKEKEDVVQYIEKLDKELNSLMVEIQKMQENITGTEAELENTRVDLEEARKTESNQYETMKKRIKYMYEHGSEDYLDIILNSSSFSDLLNRVEYVSKIAEYDDNLLKEYQASKKLVEQKESELESTLNTLNAMKEELEIEQDGVEKLVSNKTSELKKFEDNIAVSKDEVNNYEKAIAEQEELVEKLLEEERKRIEEQIRKEEEKRKQEEEKRRQEELQNNNGNNDSTNQDDTSDSGVVSSEGFRWPLNVSGTITSQFGYRTAPTAGASTYHKGIDIAVSSGTSIVAAAGGTVVTSAYQAAAGNYIMIYHGDSIYTVYMHCSAVYVSVGQEVSQGEVIAAVGSTGVSTGPHLHFGISVNGSYVNPLTYVSKP
ncbi:murein hydrolase activator EnvC family protein [Anaeromicropila populeti]|uniref:Murein DD-endopeptidase MepM and murein hydrolase activator NlpD, contain LysM domain n=1 Tax=Anaeromicropila populeti TaxID=37658 RepID=A0A1I6IEJ3_9FIRM|nr:M23 family metallopeptidase [Anaeromicropila populeti]SFR65111.1 Murein DD-endopeptidase MepM and murein hydrolase activator NlpD, contain LysM domain [Anaeromicropila populeti]